jgi:hypothetical protein
VALQDIVQVVSVSIGILTKRTEHGYNRFLASPHYPAYRTRKIDFGSLLTKPKLDSLFHEPFQQEPINDFDNDSHDNPLRLADGRMHQPIAIA